VKRYTGVVDHNLDAPSVPNGVWLTLKRRAESQLPRSAAVVADHGDGADVVLDTSRGDERGESPVLAWTPGAATLEEELRVLAPDFGAWLLATLEAVA
jgi:hypothetical protein